MGMHSREPRRLVSAKINHRAAESQNDFPGPNIPIGKDAQADHHTQSMWKSRVGYEVLYKLTFFGEQEKRRLVHKFRKSLDGCITGVDLTRWIKQSLHSVRDVEDRNNPPACR